MINWSFSLICWSYAARADECIRECFLLRPSVRYRGKLPYIREMPRWKSRTPITKLSTDNELSAFLNNEPVRADHEENQSMDANNAGPTTRRITAGKLLAHKVSCSSATDKNASDVTDSLSGNHAISSAPPTASRYYILTTMYCDWREVWFLGRIIQNVTRNSTINIIKRLLTI